MAGRIVNEFDEDEFWRPTGGAIALGTLGATGDMLLGTALDELERLDKQAALIAMCIAGGQGITTILERLT